MDVLKKHSASLCSLFRVHKYYIVLVTVTMATVLDRDIRVVLDDGDMYFEYVYRRNEQKVPSCMKAFLQIIKQNIRCFKK